MKRMSSFPTRTHLNWSGLFDRVIVLRTLSKSHSLAGLRLGFAAANPTLLAGLAKVKDSYNIDAIAARVGAAAMRDTTYTQTNIARVRVSRAYLTEQLDTLGFRVWPSQANFVLAQPPQQGRPAPLCGTQSTAHPGAILHHARVGR